MKKKTLFQKISLTNVEVKGKNQIIVIVQVS